MQRELYAAMEESSPHHQTALANAIEPSRPAPGAESAMREFRAEVSAFERRGLSFHDSWARAKAMNPELFRRAIATIHGGQTQVSLANDDARKRVAKACSDFAEKAANHMKKTGRTWSESWQDCKSLFPALANEMELPANVKASTDGQHLIPTGGSHLSAEQRMKLGLSLNAKPEEIRVFLKASEIPVTPEIAAHIVVALVRHFQIVGGLKFDDAMEFLKSHMTEVWKQAAKV
jgi:hypothetical protein